MKNVKEKGITLIALVVTIVVLLILAGVSIAMLAGEDGIIRQAQNAKDKTKEAEIEEKVKLAIVSAMASGRGNIDTAKLQEELEKLDWDGDVTAGFPAIGKINGMDVTIEANGDVTVTEGTLSDDDDNKDDDDDDSIAGKKFDDEETITIGGKPVKVPGKATISGIAGEYENVDNGIVIYIIPEDETVTDWYADEDENDILDVQENYDQFVWVPVPNAIAVDKDGNGTINTTDIDKMIEAGEYPMAIATDGTNYRGVLYDFSEKTDSEGKKYVSVSDRSYSATLGYREPAYLESSSSADGSSYNTVGITQDSLQSEFNTMVNKVNSNKGFWVGRYETSNMVGTKTTSDDNELNKETVEADTINRVTVIKGETTGISYDSTIPNYINWYRMYAQQKNYSKLALGTTSTTTSSMIWGSQWDQIMIWMKEVKNTVNTVRGEYYITNSVGMGNYTVSSVDDGYSSISSPAPTGCFDVKNIYDLAGNLAEWSLGAYTTSYCRSNYSPEAITLQRIALALVQTITTTAFRTVRTPALVLGLHFGNIKV